MRVRLCLVLVSLALTGCRMETYVSAPLAGDGREIVVQKSVRFGVEAGYRVSVRSNGKNLVLATRGTDGGMGLEEVAAVGTVVGVLVCNDWAPAERMAFSIADGGVVAFSDQLVRAMGAVLERRYKLTAAEMEHHGNGPLAWACAIDSGARSRFRSMVDERREPIYLGFGHLGGAPAELQILDVSKIVVLRE